MTPTKYTDCTTTVPCTTSNPCGYCRNKWFGETVKDLKLAEPKDFDTYVEAKKHLNPKANTLL